ncbi:MAG TPA: class I SAM-dependent methyltransferase [bacterium]|nr:class I SAM-dependent methyltransferase [bacterium]HQI48884.1 class I SAM-dependent methyltransferase [bacterium]HQJ66139.1 class I SAM-dependent methyltransferase [bacterium]
MRNQLEYGNWIRKKILFILGVCTLVFFALIFLPFGFLYRIFMTGGFIFAAVSFLFPLYAYIMFSQRGGKYQDKVYQLITQSLGDGVTGQILDIGAGNGVLAVKLAQIYPEARVTGIDYWGKDWEYSKNACERNALIGKVKNRVRFQKGDAAKLEFDDDMFDAVVSNLTFHEVRSVKDKREVVLEALRVLKPAGRFAFVDYFYDTKRYGSPDDFKKHFNLSQLEYKPIKELIEMPFLLRHPKIFGKVGLLYGKK